MRQILNITSKIFNKKAPFAVEKALLAGTHRTRSQQPSILHFSLNKAATQYTKNILRAIAAENGLTPVGMNEWAFSSRQPYLDHLTVQEMQAFKQVFKPKGYLYSVFGGMVEGIDHMEDYRIVLMVRDPRDILVSLYYSTAYSHALPGEASDKREAFLEKREKAKAQNIDAFVQEQSPRLKSYMERYQRLLTDRWPHAHLLTYEAMTNDFEGWLQKLIAASGCRVSDTLVKTLHENHALKKPKTENIYQHNRSGKEGDYAAKLKPDTIDWLNIQFTPFLENWGYR
jgi:hypothetical protein